MDILEDPLFQARASKTIVHEQVKQAEGPKERVCTWHSWVRWVLSFVLCFIAYYINILASVIAGWRTPQMDALPDLGHELLAPYLVLLQNEYGPNFLRHLPDYFVVFQAATVALTLIFHPQRLIISRRLFIILGLVLLFRAFCVTVTNLPDMSPHCRQQFQKEHFFFTPVTGKYKELPIFPTAFIRAKKVLLNPMKDTCGDLMFSGHTVGLWISWLCLNEYCASRIVRHIVFLTSLCGTVSIIATLFHYTLDVTVAIFVSYTSWNLYHRFAASVQLHVPSGIMDHIMDWFERDELTSL